MSEGLNRATLLGNLGADPELVALQNGTTILKLRLATSKSWLDGNGAKQERTEWHAVALFDKNGKRAASLVQMLHKGDRVYVEGEIQTSSYEKDGEKRYRTEIIASNVLLCGKPAGQGGDDRYAPPPQRSRQPAPSPRGRAPADDFDSGPEVGDDEIPF